jgi:hypothetical protein
MRLAQAVRVGAWLLIGINLLMAVGTIGIFTRMAPAIAVIIEHNDRSLKACEEMLAVLAVNGTGTSLSAEPARVFRSAFGRVKSNITEPEEPRILDKIEPRLEALLKGETASREAVVADVLELGRINREAMAAADRRAQQLGRAGAWGVVFMALSAFMAGVIFIRNLTRRVVLPLQEIHDVIAAQRNGETMRRCVAADLSQDVAVVFTGINELIDRCRELEGRGEWV